MKTFPIVYKDFTFTTVNEDMVEEYKKHPNFLAVLPYDLYWNFEKDECTNRYNERMYSKVQGWIEGFKYAKSNP